ncbi:MAG: hypothetical protein Q9227_003787 [Pyrenula ochraceoflavens]
MFVGLTDPIPDSPTTKKQYGQTVQCVTSIPDRSSHLRNTFINDQIQSVCSELADNYKSLSDPALAAKEPPSDFMFNMVHRSGTGYSADASFMGLINYSAHNNMNMHVWACSYATVPDPPIAPDAEKDWFAGICTNALGTLNSLKKDPAHNGKKDPDDACIQGMKISTKSNVGMHWASKGGVVHITADGKQAVWAENDPVCTNCLFSIGLDSSPDFGNSARVFWGDEAGWQDVPNQKTWQ